LKTTRLNGGVPLRLETTRLVICPLARRHITEFTRYRNIPTVARYQDWTLPYTRDLAHELVDEMEILRRPTPGRWVQLAIEHDGDLVGDFAVWIDDAEELAMVGYTVAPEHQGHGYAVEAATAVIEWLFRRTRVHRIAATIDPRNLPSARVLERSGFEYVGTARSAALARGEWTDDARFSLLRTDWHEWRSRPTGPPRNIEFVEVTADNVEEVGRIDVASSQRRFVASVGQSIADATHPPSFAGVPREPWYRAIEADRELAGFIMLALPTRTQPISILWRLLVDLRHQRRGIARRSIAMAAEMLLLEGHEHLDVHYVDEPGGPEAFYRRLGFEPSEGLSGDGEIWARARLDRIVEIVRGTG
jgi:RimJ/RimL family protein N-acetyltransferase